jgi:hypothetical protein
MAIRLLFEPGVAHTSFCADARGLDMANWTPAAVDRKNHRGNGRIRARNIRRRPDSAGIATGLRGRVRISGWLNAPNPESEGAGRSFKQFLAALAAVLY